METLTLDRGQFVLKQFRRLLCLMIVLVGAGGYVSMLFADDGHQFDEYRSEVEKTVFLPAVMLNTTISRPASSVPFVINARIYPDADDLLQAHDGLGVSAARYEADTPVDTTLPGGSSKFEQALAVLNNINGQVTGVRKYITFSSVEDLKRLGWLLPDDVEGVSYNTEPGMTPEAELDDLPTYVPMFVAIVHGLGKEAGWSPTLNLLLYLEENGRIADILPHLDMIGIQHQRLLMLCGLHGETGNSHCLRDGQPIGFVEETQRRVALYKSIAPDLQVRVQLWYGTNSVDEAIKAFLLVKNDIDSAVFFANTDSGDSAQATRQVLTGLGR